MVQIFGNLVDGLMKNEVLCKRQAPVRTDKLILPLPHCMTLTHLLPTANEKEEKLNET